MPLEFVFPLLSAVLYVIGVLLLKRAAELGADVWRVSAVCNWASAIAFLPLLLLGGTIPSVEMLWQPALVGALFVAGQTIAFVAFRIGDVSVATPVLGLKIILVALFTTVLLGDRLRPALWAAAVLSSVAVALLNRAPSASPHHRIGATILLSGLAATIFAIFDVLVQKWSPAWGSGRFLPVMIGFVALYSVALWLLGNKSGAPSGRIFLRGGFLLGAICLAVQSVLFISTIALRGHATAANVLYSSRGLWSVLAVWYVGHWFDNRERQLGSGVLGWRLFGAALLLTAITLVFLA
jgi:drug/metabolite transporter (DMT)-like permease